jgi:hypothetical protein
MILGFVILSFILFGIAGYIAYRYIDREITLRHRRAYQKYREQVKKLTALRTEFDQLSHAVNQIPAAKNLLNMPGINVRDNMENRYARENPKVVAVDGVQKVVNG